MSHIVSRQTWGVIDIDTTLGRILVQQYWHYHWVLYDPSVRPWSDAEKHRFHTTLDRQIWSTWSQRLRLRVDGTGPFAKRFARAGVAINFDIRRVHAAGHWHVTVRKMPPGSNRTTYLSNVQFDARRIDLDTMDLATAPASNARGASAANFLTGPHLFGHTLALRDEHDTGNPHLADTESIMNIGRALRPRHLELVLGALNSMLPGTRFAAAGAMS